MEVISFGGRSEASQLGVYSSDQIRSQPNADASQMDRAHQQATAHEPTSYSGTKHLYRNLFYHLFLMMK
jgi:hypothetical protein